MLPVIAIVGRPNVGKSTLFNRFTKSRDALVADMPGVTRDRQYGHGHYEDKTFIIIDTGGVGEALEHDVDVCMAEQSWAAAEEAHVILFMLDAKVGVTPVDKDIFQRLRKLQKPVVIVANKTDGLDEDIALADFYQLGVKTVIPIAASQNRGMTKLVEYAFSLLPEIEGDEEAVDQGTKVAVVGKPNVGKSTLINRMLGEERLVVFDHPGTTRDSIFIPFERRDQKYTLIDTAGVRRRSKVSETIEKFSVIKTLQAIESCHVVVFMIDGSDALSEQDLKLLGFILNAGKSLVVAVNKWDGLTQDQRDQIKTDIDRRMHFLDFAKIHFISAKHGTGVGDLYGFIDKAYESAHKEVKTNRVNEILAAAVQQHQPPIVKGHRIKIRYGHYGGHNPPVLVLHGNQLNSLPGSYKRYLVKFFRQKLKLVGTPIRLQLKTSDNPFKDRKKVELTLSQRRKTLR